MRNERSSNLFLILFAFMINIFAKIKRTSEKRTNNLQKRLTICKLSVDCLYPLFGCFACNGLEYAEECLFVGEA